MTSKRTIAWRKRVKKQIAEYAKQNPEFAREQKRIAKLEAERKRILESQRQCN